MFSTLDVVAPPAAEPVALDLARLHLRVDQAGDDELVAGYLTAARCWAELYLGRCLAPQQLLWTVGEEPPRGFLAMPLNLVVLPMWLTWPLAGAGPIRLPRQPVVSVDAVSYGRWGLADTALAAGADYDVDLPSSRLRIRPGSQVAPNDHLSVTFTARYGAGALPQPIVSAILLLTAFLYENRGDAGGDLPRAAEWLLTPYRLVSFG